MLSTSFSFFQCNIVHFLTSCPLGPVQGVILSEKVPAVCSVLSFSSIIQESWSGDLASFVYSEMFRRSCANIRDCTPTYLTPDMGTVQLHYRGQDSSVGTATRYGLDGPGIEFQWGRRLSAPVQTGPGAHPASYTIGTGSLSRGVKRPGRGVTTHPI